MQPLPCQSPNNGSVIYAKWPELPHLVHGFIFNKNELTIDYTTVVLLNHSIGRNNANE